MDAASFEGELALREGALTEELSRLEAAPAQHQDRMQILLLAGRLATVRQERALLASSSLPAVVLELVPSAATPPRRQVSWAMAAACAGLLLAGGALLFLAVPSSAEGGTVPVQAGY